MPCDQYGAITAVTIAFDTHSYVTQSIRQYHEP
jgi:hypothetical protein